VDCPARSLAPVVIVAVNVVRGARTAYWSKRRSCADGGVGHGPATGVVPCLRVKVAVLMVKGSIASLKVAVIALVDGHASGRIGRYGERHGGCGGVRG